MNIYHFHSAPGDYPGAVLFAVVIACTPEHAIELLLHWCGYRPHTETVCELIGIATANQLPGVLSAHVNRHDS